MLLGLLFWYCEIQDFHTFLGLRHPEPHQGFALDLSGTYNVPRPPAMLINDLRSLHILSKTRLSITHLLERGFLSVFCRGEEKFVDTSSVRKLHPSTHRKSDTSLNEKNPIHGRETAMIWKFHAQNFQTYSTLGFAKWPRTTKIMLVLFPVLKNPYYMTNSYRPGLKKFDWFKAGL